MAQSGNDKPFPNPFFLVERQNRNYDWKHLREKRNDHKKIVKDSNLAYVEVILVNLVSERE